jgi:transposase
MTNETNETNETNVLFADLPEGGGGNRRAEIDAVKAPARVVMPNRKQLEFRASDLESLLPEAHRARVVWGFVERCDLSALYEGIKSREGTAGRDAIAPEILLSLWLYATLEGVGAARELARLIESHDAYRWICGGVQVNYHTLSDFRSDQSEVLDELLSESVASLMAVGVVKLAQVAQDGMRVRASAGTGSFRREEKLKGYLDAARARVQALKREIDADPGALTRRQAAARERAARERQERIEQALARLSELAQIKQRQGKKGEDARASVTDADATVMKMGDGGFRPAYNAQYATDGESQVIVGAEVVLVGSDQGQLTPMLEQVNERCGQYPKQMLVDGGYNSHEQVEAASQHTEVYAPVPKPKDEKNDPHQPKPGDSKAVAEWRVRMASDEAKEIYKNRAAVAECVNAQARNRGLIRLLVRGRAKVKSVMLMYALAHNLMRMFALAPRLIGIGTNTSGVACLVAESG